MDVVWWPTGNFGYPRGKHGRNGQSIQAVVNHTMNGTRAGYHAYLADPERNSANYSTYRDGHIEQHVRDADAAWCNGPMHAPDLTVPWIKDCWEHDVNPNLVTLSIEHEGMSGEPLTDAQYQACLWLNRKLLNDHGLPKDRIHVVGHYQIDSVNKARCPGSAFPWTRLMTALRMTQGDGDADTMTVDEVAKVKDIAQRVYDANLAIRAELDKLDAAVGKLPAAERIRAQVLLSHNAGTHDLRALIGLP